MLPAPAADRFVPTRWQAVLFRVKTAIFQARRAWRNLGRGGARGLGRCSAETANGATLAESRSALYPSETATEFALQAGKVQNLRVAAASLDGLLIPGGAVFSFWTHVPRPTRRRGFAAGRELREGCIVPSVGGGLCQLSNALYDAALTAGCAIVERHAHSRRVPGSMAEVARDATVFWNYVDLRFRPATDCRLDVRLTVSELVVRLVSLSPAAGEVRPHVEFPVSRPDSPEDPAMIAPPVESCETCGVTSCFRHPEPQPDTDTAKTGVTAWLVDAWWPEFDRYQRHHREAGDWLFLPLDGRRYRVGGYRWDAEGFAQTRQAPWETLRRSWTSRRLAAQGAERQRALLRFDEALADRYAHGLPPEAMRLVVSQTLLPHLWRAGALGGRTFDVLMTRLPLAALQATLDRAAAHHPGSRTLTDFRAPAALVADEAAALAAARRWITPHDAVAALAGSRARKLRWEIPTLAERRPDPGARDVLFPASTLGRKGAYETAEAARRLGLRVQLGGPLLENDAAGCWRGVETTPANENWAGVAAVVLPAWVEHQPRRLLRAAAAGVPVVAAEGCGLRGTPGIVTVPAGDVEALTEVLAEIVETAHLPARVSPSGKPG